MIGQEDAKQITARDIINTGYYEESFQMEDIFSFAAATVVSTAVNTIDSLSFGLFDVDSQETMNWMSKDLGEYYNTHKEGVELASFIGGMILPGMAAAKAVKWARSGNTVLSGSYKASAKWEAKALTGIKDAGRNSEDFTTAMSKLKLNTLGQGAAEGILYEASFVLFNNQHSYLDNDYDFTDFTIGAGLGALVGPLSWIIKKKSIMTKSREELIKQMDTAYAPIKAKAGDPGTILSFLGIQSRTLKENIGKGDVSIQVGREQEQAITYAESLLVKQLDDMMDSGLKVDELSGIKIGESNEAIDTLYNMTEASPSAFEGVTNFAIFNSKAAERSLSDSIIKHGRATFDLSSGQQAKDIFFPEYTGLWATRENRPAKWIELQEGVEEITITLNRQVDEPMKQWLSGYLSLPDVAVLPIKFRGKTRGMKINQGALDREIGFKQMDLMQTDEFRSYDSMLEIAENTDNRAVIDTFFEGHFLGEIEARSVLSVPTSDINKKGNLIADKYAIDPLKQSVTISDTLWREARYAEKNTKYFDSYSMGATELPKLEVLLNRHLTNKPFPEIKIGEDVLATAEEAVEYLWLAKQNMAEQMIKQNGASTPQVAKALNLPHDSVEAMIVAQFNKSQGELGVSRYVKAGAESDAIHVLGVKDKFGKQVEEKITQMLDNDAIENIHLSFAQTELKKTQQVFPGLEELGTEVLFSPQMKYLRDNIQDVLVSVEGKNVLISSADMQLRETGAVGDMITTLGKTAQTIRNKIINGQAKSLTPTLTAVRADPISTTQFGLFEQAVQKLNASEIKQLEYDSGLKKMVAGNTDDGTPVYLTYANEDREIVFTDSMSKFLEAYMPVMRDNMALHNLNRRLNGKKDSTGGVWLPYRNISEQFIAYKMPKGQRKGQDVELILGDSAADLEQKVIKAQELWGGRNDIITREDMFVWNELNRYAELSDLRVADTGMKKSGVAISSIKPGTQALDDFMVNLRSHTLSQLRGIERATASTVHDKLSFMASLDQSAVKSSKGFLGQKVQRKASIPEIASKTLLNQSMMESTPMMDMLNNYTKVSANIALNATANLIKTTKNKKTKEQDWEALSAGLKEAGIPNPWENAFDWSRAQLGHKDMAQHKIAKAQSILVTLNLRLLEVSHAAVTVMSLPVILSAEARHLNKGGQSVTKLLMDSAVFTQGKTPEAASVMLRGKELGHTRGIIAEASELMAELPTNASGAFSEKFNKLIDTLSTPSDRAEDFARELAYAVGYNIAKGKYPEASMPLLETHAAAFTVRTMGNYSARQKPTLFQGSFGSMVGLYQTFMLTMGQNLFRYAEKSDYKAITQMMATQGGIFGMESLPFFQDFNTLLGEHYSDDHNDIVTTAYKVFGDSSDQSRSIAEFILFGLPSAAFGSGVYTRGTLDPRTPFDLSSSGGVAFRPAIYDASMKASQAIYNTVSGTYGAIKSGGDFKDIGTAAMQGVAGQSIWRPAARVTELLLGASHDLKGEQLSGPEEIYEPFSIFSRAIGARPLKEQALRNLRFQTSYYNTVDADKKKKVSKQVRRVVEGGQDMRQLDNLFADWTQSHGTMRGWKQIMNSSYEMLDTSHAERLSNYAKNQPAIQEIADSYAN